jgi:hypothetical protein
MKNPVYDVSFRIVVQSLSDSTGFCANPEAAMIQNHSLSLRSLSEKDIERLGTRREKKHGGPMFLPGEPNVRMQTTG